MKKRKCYIETSVWNQLFHRDRPDWKEITEIFLKNYKTNNIDLYISDIVIREIANAPKHVYNKLSKEISEHSPIILELNEEAFDLSRIYLDKGIFGKEKENTISDAEHVAICSVYELDYLVTWNYRHLYKANNMLLFNSLNLQNGYSKPLSIITPEGLII
jgi:predicted nucleic acid-binding protein